MNSLKKNSFYIGLDKYSVYIEDKDNSIFNVIEVPEVFPIGKTSFLILGSDYLKKETDVLVEILDSKQQVIYHEIIKYASEKRGRIVSVYVYDHIARGPIKITILGILNNVPHEWQNRFNVKKVINSYVDPYKINNSPLKFLNTPNINVKYTEKYYISYSFSGPEYLTHSLLDSDDGYIGFIHPKYERTDSNSLYYIKIFSSSYNPNLDVNYIPNTVLKKDWVGAEFYAKNIKLKHPSGNTNLVFEIPEYTGSIIELIDENTFLINPPFLYSFPDYPYLIFDTIDDIQTNAYIKYKNSYSSSITQYIASFIELDIKNINQYSGLVDKIRIYKENKTAGGIDNYLGEYKLQSSNLFINSDYINIEYGKFINIASLNWWEYKHISGIDFGTGSIPLHASPIISFDNKKFFGSVKLTPKYTFYKNQNDPPLINEENRKFRFIPKNFLLEVFKGNVYEVIAKYSCITSSLVVDYYVSEPPEPPIPIYITQNFSASLGVYISGSVYSTEEIDTEFNYNIGKRIGYLTSTESKNFNEVKFEFIPKKSGTITLVFAVFSGEWNIADIEIKQKTLFGFNSNNFKVYIPLNNQKRNELSSIKVEFLNPDGEISNLSTYKTKELLLKNQPLYVERNDNLILGKLFIADLPERGIAFSAESGSSIITSNYFGKFNAQTSGLGGILLYSSSIFPSYSKTGIGFELNTGNQNKGFLEFRYDPISGSYLNISASIYVLSGSNIANALESGSFVYSFTNLTTWSIEHNLNEKYLSVQTFNNLDEIIIPEKIVTVNNNKIDIYFTYPATGKALIYRGGYFAGNNTHLQFTGFASQSFTNQKTWSFNHNLNQKFVFTETFNNNGFKIIPNGLKLINNNLLEIYFENNTSGVAIATTGQNIKQLETYTIICSGENSTPNIGNNIATIYIPHNFYLYSVKASLNTTSSQVTKFNIKINNNTNLFADDFIIPANTYYYSQDPDISTILEGSRLSVNIIQTGSGITGLKIYLLGYR